MSWRSSVFLPTLVTPTVIPAGASLSARTFSLLAQPVKPPARIAMRQPIGQTNWSLPFDRLRSQFIGSIYPYCRHASKGIHRGFAFPSLAASSLSEKAGDRHNSIRACSSATRSAAAFGISDAIPWGMV